MTIMRIGLDLAKNVFDVHGVDEQEKPALRKTIKRCDLLPFLFICRLVLSQWKVAAVPITGPEN